MRLTRPLVALVLFAMAFGYVEAAVVVYLRDILEPVGQGRGSEVFPLLTAEQLHAAGGRYVRAVMTELGRELATLLLLGAAALLMARNVRQWLAGFMIAFGLWDVFYYVFLKLLVGWPQSLWTWDALFLWPTVWAGPVIAPVLVAGLMIVAGVAVLWREARGRPVRFAWVHRVLIIVGAGILVVAFCWDWRNTSAGGLPNPFNWPLFLVGLAAGAAGFAHAVFTKQVADTTTCSNRRV
jgi:hypothetical protein